MAVVQIMYLNGKTLSQGWIAQPFFILKKVRKWEPLKVIILLGKRNLMEGDTLSSYPDLKRIEQNIRFLLSFWTHFIFGHRKAIK